MQFGDVEDGKVMQDVTVSLAGRVSSKRASGAKLLFYDIQGDGTKVQIITDAR